MKTLEQLSQESLRTAPDGNNLTASMSRMSLVTMQLLHAGLGLSSETGELMSTIKAHIMYGKPLDVENLEEELGDVWWYFNLMCEALVTTPDRIIQMNIDKLKIRYPEKYSDADALERKDKITCSCKPGVTTCYICEPYI